MTAPVHEEEVPFHPELGGLVAAWRAAHRQEVQVAWQTQETRSEETGKAEIRRMKDVERAKSSKRMTEEEATKLEEKFVRKYNSETTGMQWMRISCVADIDCLCDQVGTGTRQGRFF